MTIEELCKKLDGCTMYRDVPEWAKRTAKKNGWTILVGGSDDLLYAFGAENPLTKEKEISVTFGSDFSSYPGPTGDFARKAGLKVWFCGKIETKAKELRLPRIDPEKHGTFFYTVNPNIEHCTFSILEEDGSIYSTGLVFDSGAINDSE